MVRIWRAGDQLSVTDLISLGESNHVSLGHTLQHVQAYPAQFVDVGVVDLSEESDLWRRHWIVVGEEEFKFEDATCNTFQHRRDSRDLAGGPHPHMVTERAHG